MGLLLSAGLLGMGAGSLFLAPLADRVGRRTIILVSLLIIAAGMLLSAVAQGPEQLAIFRAFTGVGIGGMLASLTVITAEYSSNRWRSAAISMQSTGYALGATLGGVIAGVLLTHYGWRSVFVFGGLATIATLPLVLIWLPESIDHLVARQPRNALGKVNDILARMKRPGVTELPDAASLMTDVESKNRPRFASLFRGTLVRQTIGIWLAFFFVMASFYFVMSWTPKLLVQAGMSTSEGITGGVLLNIGGMIGCTLFSGLSAKYRLRSLLLFYLASSVVSLVLFCFGTSSLQVSLSIAVLIGAAVSGCIGGLYSLVPLLYPIEVRATGMGWAIGMGRIGAILSPLSVGALIDSGWQVGHLYALFAVPLVLAAIAVVVVVRNTPTLVRGADGRIVTEGSGAA